MNTKISNKSNERWWKAVEYLLSKYGFTIEEQKENLTKLRKRFVPAHVSVSMIIGSRPFPWEKENLGENLEELDNYFIPLLDEC